MIQSSFIEMRQHAEQAAAWEGGMGIKLIDWLRNYIEMIDDRWV
jgi:hypothetical protein